MVFKGYLIQVLLIHLLDSLGVVCDLFHNQILIPGKERLSCVKYQVKTQL